MFTGRGPRDKTGRTEPAGRIGRRHPRCCAKVAGSEWDTTAHGDARLADIMRRYAFLILPSHNRVYADAAPALARAELAVLSAALPDGEISEESVAETVIGGMPYVTFERGDMSERDAALLANLSSLYALFEVTG